MTNSASIAYFTTTKCVDWKPVISDQRFKQIIVDSLCFLVHQQRVLVYGFVIMNNHFHILWRFLGRHTRESVQRDFLKYTSQQILKIIRTENTKLLMELWVEARDREYQVWARNSLSVPVWSPFVWRQKLGYIHYNPVKAGLCVRPEDYKYSSASSYKKAVNEWTFITRKPNGP